MSENTIKNQGGYKFFKIQKYKNKNLNNYKNILHVFEGIFTN
jgi:hypothetical protein